MVIRNQSIRTKLAFAFILAFVAIVAIGSVSLSKLGAVRAVTSEIRETWLPLLGALGDLKRSLTTHHLLATRRTQSLDFRVLAETGERLAIIKSVINKELQSISHSLQHKEEEENFEQLNSSWEAYVISFDHVVEQLNSGETSRALKTFSSSTDPVFAQTFEAVLALERHAEKHTLLAEARVEGVYDKSRVVLVLWVGTSALVALLGIFWVSRAVASPLQRVSEIMSRLTDDATPVEVGGNHSSANEINKLVTAVSTYRKCILQARDFAKSAEADRLRLEVAIAGMPIGVAFYGHDNNLVFCNDLYGQIYKLPEELVRSGTPHDAIVDACIRRNTFFGKDPQAFAREMGMIIAAGKKVIAARSLQDGRTIATTIQPISGGWLSIHEDITEQRRNENRIYHMANHDALTGLANRRYFGEQVNKALEASENADETAILCVDLDRFKEVNDTLGHPAGDALLVRVADCLRACIGPRDIVARFGGDEFVIAQIGGDQPSAARDLASHLIDVLGAETCIEGHQVAIQASVGIARCPEDGIKLEDLLKRADMALRLAKQGDRGAIIFYKSVMCDRVREQREMEADLRRALANNEFSLVYQPIIGLGANAVVGFEALVRWQHPERGCISPAEFIPVAENMGLIVPLGEWVLRKACADAAMWPSFIKVAVNLSPVQFRSKRVAEAVFTALATSRLPANRLELEITEGVLLDRTDDVLRTLKHLRALGVRIALDDFGTGYSSLSYLQSFPFDKIKIDGTFARKLSEEESSIAIIRAIADLGTSLGMTTTAVGIETMEQLEIIRSEGGTEVQGFVFSKPRPFEETAPLIEQLGSEINAIAI
ncbi:hypothetical protein Q669_32020 [Labrenzia sp. C1B10]|uniref:EAL domain-containing protein n=1 Tax=unclassified Labrenzia TaxID=2648686 RepID=UPI0003B8970A|nr:MULTISPECIES: EAL domain-containing protein [unclassified Labrenzia]ERP91228.1 hypothetical protein Q669_32020 [Labrenzia sp. C1B10]ERS04175.1 hypothetical protein Q675_30770 [Labrenzia sp. C1B70]